MKYYDLTQGSPEWFSARAGIPTASSFDKIITAKKGVYSSSADGYQNLLIAELVLGQPLEKFQPTYWMERGSQFESDARALYEFNTGETLHRGGFCTTDEDTAGASPDARILNDDGTIKGLVEIKCPAPWTHIENLLRAEDKEIDPDYIPQVQGQMLVTGASWVDWFSYHPEMPPAHIRTHRDNEYIEKLHDCLRQFKKEMDEKLKTLVNAGHLKIIPIYQRPKETSEIKNYLYAG